MAESVYFSGNKDNPHHLSVGAVLWQDTHIALIRKPHGHVTLPQETFYASESMEAAVARGLSEEVGVSNAIIRRFIGSLQTTFTREDGTLIDKTTVYFEVTSDKVVPDTRKLEADESDDQVIWMTPSAAISALQEKQNDEYKIVQTVTGETT
jgi:hypothetical protein